MALPEEAPARPLGAWPAAPAFEVGDPQRADLAVGGVLVGVGSRRRRRSPVAGGRPYTVMVALSEFEMAQVVSASAREGLAAGAWLGEVGVRAARCRATGPGGGPGPHEAPGVVRDEEAGSVMQALMMARAELMDLRRLLRNVGGNLNQIAAHVNSTGELAASTGQVLGLVARAVARVDTAVAAHPPLMDVLRRAAVRSSGRRRAGPPTRERG